LFTTRFIISSNNKLQIYLLFIWSRRVVVKTIFDKGQNLYVAIECTDRNNQPYIIHRVPPTHQIYTNFNVFYCRRWLIIKPASYPSIYSVHLKLFRRSETYRIVLFGDPDFFMFKSNSECLLLECCRLISSGVPFRDL
jgi:hypothetical protein